MELSSKDREGFHVVEVHGNILVGDVDSFEMYLKSLKSRNVLKIAVEMSQVDSIVSGAIGALMGLADELEAMGGRLVLLTPNVKVLNVFRRMGLDQVFRIYDSEEETRRSFS
ncbi:MAG: STAS domain-containing protein [Planctomycetes bacterium]|nr:STAS domain-containing protein [Planctomycetota bacterium]